MRSMEIGDKEITMFTDYMVPEILKKFNFIYSKICLIIIIKIIPPKSSQYINNIKIKINK